MARIKKQLSTMEKQVLYDMGLYCFSPANSSNCAFWTREDWINSLSHWLTIPNGHNVVNNAGLGVFKYKEQKSAYQLTFNNKARSVNELVKIGFKREYLHALQSVAELHGYD